VAAFIYLGKNALLAELLYSFGCAIRLAADRWIRHTAA